MATEYKSYKEFWPFYVSQHSSATNRSLHFIGTLIVLFLFALALVSGRYGILALCPIAGYAFAWAGHFFIEKNRPATFSYPVWSFMGDFQMFFFICLGRMDREVRRLELLEK